MQRECVPWKPVLLGRGGERQAQAEENGSRVNEHSHAVMAALGPAAVTQADDEPPPPVPHQEGTGYAE